MRCQPLGFFYDLTDANDSFSQNLRPQTAAMHQARKNFRMRKPLQMRAGLAESEAARFHVTDPKLLFDQMIQRDASRDDVAAAGAQTEINLELAS